METMPLKNAQKTYIKVNAELQSAGSINRWQAVPIIAVIVSFDDDGSCFHFISGLFFKMIITLW